MRVSLGELSNTLRFICAKNRRMKHTIYGFGRCGIYNRQDHPEVDVYWVEYGDLFVSFEYDEVIKVEAARNSIVLVNRVFTHDELFASPIYVDF